MTKEKPRLIDKSVAKLSKTIREFQNEADCLGYIIGNCCEAENIIIQCKEMLEEDIHIDSTDMIISRDSLLDDIDYFLNKEAE